MVDVKICDAHVHLGESGPWQPYHEPTIFVDDLLKLFDQFNVERAIVFPNPNVGDKYPAANDYIAMCVKKFPKRFVGFGRVDPRRGEEAIRELVRIKEKLGLAGLKLHPMVECFRPDHVFFEGFFKKVNALEMPVLIHTGDGFSSPGLAVKVAKKFPKLIMILGHLKEGCLGALQECENVYVETSGAIPEFVEMAVDVDENRVLFGSDVPYYRYKVQLAVVDAANISEKAKRKVYYENFQKLFQLEI
jgi:predicted TIM-barrel fold metal-dependent hydrolase